MPAASAERLSARFRRMSELCAGERVTLRALLPGLGPGEHAFVMLLVAVCFMHPIPMPGLSWGLAAVVTAAGARMLLRRGLWLPALVLDRPIPSRLPARLFAAAAEGLRRCEGLVRPRGARLAAHAWTERANGLAVLICGLMLFTPLPVPANYPPAVALLLLSLGMLESDVLLLGLGWAATAAGAALFVALGAYGWAGLRLALAKL